MSEGTSSPEGAPDRALRSTAKTGSNFRFVISFVILSLPCNNFPCNLFFPPPPPYNVPYPQTYATATFSLSLTPPVTMIFFRSVLLLGRPFAAAPSSDVCPDVQEACKRVGKRNVAVGGRRGSFLTHRQPRQAGSPSPPSPGLPPSVAKAGCVAGARQKK